MGHPEKSGLSTPICKPSQETFNTNMVENFVRSPTAIYTPYSDKHNKSYRHRYVADQRRFSRKSETNSFWRKGKNFFQNWTKGTIWSKLMYESWSFQIGAGFQSGNIFSSVLPFRTKSVLDERSSLNSMLTANGTNLWEEDYTNVIDNFDNFPKSINTPLSDKWFRSNGFWKLRGAAGNSSFLDRLTWTDSFGVLSLHPGKNRGNSAH
jgi:hypothetical protein